MEVLNSVACMVPLKSVVYEAILILMRRFKTFGPIQICKKSNHEGECRRSEVVDTFLIDNFCQSVQILHLKAKFEHYHWKSIHYGTSRAKCQSFVYLFKKQVAFKFNTTISWAGTSMTEKLNWGVAPTSTLASRLCSSY